MDQFALSAVSANPTIPKPLHSFLPPIRIGCTSVMAGVECGTVLVATSIEALQVNRIEPERLYRSITLG